MGIINESEQNNSKYNESNDPKINNEKSTKSSVELMDEYVKLISLYFNISHIGLGMIPKHFRSSSSKAFVTVPMKNRPQMTNNSKIGNINDLKTLRIQTSFILRLDASNATKKLLQISDEFLEYMNKDQAFNSVNQKANSMTYFDDSFEVYEAKTGRFNIYTIIIDVEYGRC